MIEQTKLRMELPLTLHRCAGAILAIAAVWRMMQGCSELVAQVCTAVCGALKWLVVNEELCQAFAEQGGTQTICQVCCGLPPC